MAEDVKKLLLQVDANVELLRRNLRGAAASLKEFEGHAATMSERVDGHFRKVEAAATFAKASIIGFVSGIGINGVISVGRAVLNFADDLATAADVANINIERYQTLREGLRKLEISTEQTDKVLARLNETLGAVQGGSAAAGLTEALDRMGIKSKILNGEIATTDELLDAIAAASKRYTTAAQYTADVVDIVGRKLGIDLAAALRDGGDALHEQEQAFRDTGAVISEDYVQRLADANEVLDAFVERAKHQMIIWSGDTIDTVGRVYDALSKMRWWEFLAPPAVILGKIGGAVAASKKWEDDFGLRGMATRQKRDRAVIAALPAGSDVRRMAEQQFKDTYLKAWDDLAREPPQTFSPPPGKKGGAAARPTRAPATSGLTMAELKAQRPARPDFADANPDQYAIDLSLKSFREMDEIVQRIAATPLVDADAVQGAQTVKQALMQGVIYGGNIGEALLNSFKMAVASKAFDMLFAALGGGKGGWLDGFFKVIGGAEIKGFAAGGRPPVGRASIVGEHGPELFVPDVAGSIIPNHALGGGGAVSFDLRGAVVTADLLAQMQALAAQGAITAIGVGRGDMASMQRRRLPRGLGA